MKMLRIKKDDQVKIISGKDKGRSGKVLEVLPKDGKVIVEGLNIHVRFARARRKGEKGQRLELSAPIWVSKVMLICPACGKTTRIGHEKTENNSYRQCKKCGRRI
ncbi:MAG: 50S ribosomal protein L24 [Candidatus Doudnabacteria bacterium]|nr:50S ribosomal protein L24 [Candidatus Doudnabacteria bacterium]